MLNLKFKICSIGIPVVTIPQAQYSVTVGNNILMECNIDANPAHTNVLWRKIVNGQPTDITIGNRFSGSTVAIPSLTINSAQSSDAGYYVCYASNSVGTGQSAQTYLNVVGSKSEYHLLFYLLLILAE